MRIIIRLMILWGLFLTSGCQSNAVDTGTPLEMTPSQTAEPAPPTQGDTQMAPSLPAPAGPGLQNLIEKAKEDLAQRLSVPGNQVNLVDAQEVVWPDASLGCPEEGMVYAQVLTPGYLIRLQSGDQEYEYHASKGTSIIYCENPTPPVPGTPAGI